MYKYPYTDDPEPKERPEDREDRIIRRGKKILGWLLWIAVAFFAVLFVWGAVTRLQTGL